ncbi:7-carboxy-7-deazaguanine synthase QueE [Legionella oakridgensis]|uniref:7-carboxy-7-deazaguanine synthase n=2 Tax=Legionella oakridgensis TaxID=29423 RepID=W0BHS0_9GAMM|nr:7-carboxy-7-deazaguanine synthase QueE [Legionella oakridgensis]AHE68177.1 organic radical activating enzyme [Legionella oakridgensis ATCC 33761 = DSM 21215]ETO92265.1 organic radical activating enzyme [Legionella oakridgensis RV-2-2007]KTD39623.1 radical activating enzyme [Legionella oakridgensis]STY21141.1 Organic radical activating enzyme [Legionella longbeachae]
MKKRLPNQLRITEIFHSLQGESTTIGLPTTFIRLTGCPLRCQYCDTAYAFHGGELIHIEEIISRVVSFECQHVCITGGEPLAQPGCLHLLKQLCDTGYNVSLETSGARDISTVDERVMIVMDLKTPDSGECAKNKLSNLDHLKKTDQIKFVLCSHDDYQWACTMINKHQLTARTQILFSPSWGQLNPTTLANWIVKDRLKVRFQLQLHKILWNDVPGH